MHINLLPTLELNSWVQWKEGKTGLLCKQAAQRQKNTWKFYIHLYRNHYCILLLQYKDKAKLISMNQEQLNKTKLKSWGQNTPDFPLWLKWKVIFKPLACLRTETICFRNVSRLDHHNSFNADYIGCHRGEKAIKYSHPHNAYGKQQRTTLDIITVRGALPCSQENTAIFP